MKLRYTLFATVAEWTDQTTGKRCKRTAQVGSVFQSPGGKLSMKLELLPLFPGWSGFIAFRDVTAPGGELLPEDTEDSAEVEASPLQDSTLTGTCPTT